MSEAKLDRAGLNSNGANGVGSVAPAPEDAVLGENLQQKKTDPAVRFPGVAAIALWMLMEALIGVAGVMTGHFATQAERLSVLAVATLLSIAGLGLLRMKRWGWALALAAAFLTSSYGVYLILRFHQQNYWVMTIVNFIFFFYLVRPEILRRLR